MQIRTKLDRTVIVKLSVNEKRLVEQVQILASQLASIPNPYSGDAQELSIAAGNLMLQWVCETKGGVNNDPFSGIPNK